MDEPQYKYDVALSFLAQDEPLAVELANILEERYSVFLYSRKQEQLGGTDGEKSFDEIFAKQSRAVVVLYRQGWGESPWTRIEETALRNRAYDVGYDFALFVPTDDKPTVPIYVPKTRLWIGHARFGTTGTASVIDARIQELGGSPRVLSLEERAAQVQKASEFKSFREEYLRSSDGVQAANASFFQLEAAMEQRVATLQKAAPGLGFQTKRHDRTLVCLGTGPAIRLEWHYEYANSLDGAYLELTAWKGHPPVSGRFSFGEKRYPTHTLRATPDITKERVFAWKFKSPEGERLVDASGASELILDWWMGKAENLFA